MTKTLGCLVSNKYFKSSTYFSGNLIQHTEDNSEKIASLEKQFFWTKPQYTLLNDETKKRAIFISEFGTGKTALLRTKAKRLLERNEEVVIISFEDKDSSQDSLPTNMLRAEFNEDMVFSLRGTGNKYHKKGSDDMIAMYFYTFRSFG
jgi:hypothetical protein